MPVAQIELMNSNWSRIPTEGSFVGSQGYGNKLYYIAVYEEYLPWLLKHESEFELNPNPLEPLETEIWVLGKSTATRNIEMRILKGCVKEIISGLGPGFERSCFEIAPQLQIQLGWVGCAHAVLVDSSLLLFP